MDYFTHWMITIGAGFFLVLCGVTIDFFRLREERKRSRH